MVSEELPVATHSGTVTITGVEMHVHRLDNGQTIIEADDVHRLFEAMSIGAELTEEDAMKLAKIVRTA